MAWLIWSQRFALAISCSPVKPVIYRGAHAGVGNGRHGDCRGAACIQLVQIFKQIGRRFGQIGAG